MIAAKLRKLGRLFVIKTKIEAYMVIYALGLGAAERGTHYLEIYPGYGGYLLFAACTGSVFMAGAKMLDCLKFEKKEADSAQPVPVESERAS